MTDSFTALGLPQHLADTVKALGYEAPTAIQTQAIPQLLAGCDVLAAAQTGTGKTAAFALPMIAKMLAQPKTMAPKTVRALVLAPTRELAAQIEANITAYCANTSLKTVLVFGGVNIRPQTEALQAGCDFLIATPGRLLDHAGQLNVDLTQVEFFVLDEADRMLDMGFVHDIRKVVRLLPRERQTLLFSATFSDEIRSLAQSFLKDAVHIEIARNKESALITQEAWSIAKKRKRELLRDLIVDNNWEQVLVFTRMKHTANRIAAQLEKDGIVAAAIHGNKSQSARTKALSGFKEHRIRVLVATDIAARGLDIEGLPHVINYELPNVPEDYVHRIGRTGRAGVPGHAVSLVCEDEKDLLRAIEKLLKKTIALKAAEGYDGEVPEDIARDEAERDAQRAQELERLRQSRRKNRAANPQRQKQAQRTRQAAQQEAAAAGVSDNTDERFEKKIVRKKKAPAAAGNQTSRARARLRDNASGNRRESRTNRPRAAWEPIDPFAPEHQAIFLPQTMPANTRSGKPSRSQHGARDRNNRNSNIKSTVRRNPQTLRSAERDARFESVSSNLPPGMVLRYRRR